MMAVKKSVRLVDDTIQLCHNLTLTGETNWSGSINAMAEQYNIFVTDCLPDLCEAKKFAFYCVFNNYMPHPSIDQEVQTLAWHISEGYEYDDQIRMKLDENGIDIFTFVGEIRNWSRPQKLAVIYMARAFCRKKPITHGK
jgi:hypothetical protein